MPLGKSKGRGTAASWTYEESPLLTNPPDHDLLPEPYVIGLPERYRDWRKMQQIAVVAAQNSEKRFVFQCAPTGFGKSVTYMANGQLTEGRTIILTSTKGLQDQLTRDFGEIGLVAVKGKNAYPCVEAVAKGLPSYTTVADGPCHIGFDCPKQRGGCGYFDALRAAKQSKVVVANYAAWMYLTVGRETDVLGEFDLMVCDEAHDAPEHIAGFLEAELKEEDFKTIGATPLQVGCDIADWKEWANHWLEPISRRIAAARKEGKAKVMRELQAVDRKVTLVAGSRRDEWVMEDVVEGSGFGRDKKRRVLRFAPIDCSRYAERILFQGVEKVVLYSATVRPKTASLLGIAEGDYEFNEYPSTFPVHLRPVYHIPTIRLSFRSTDSEMAIWLGRIDQILRSRPDRRGLIHTVSFKRRNFIVANSGYQGRFLSNDSRNTATIVDDFRTSRPETVLISPSMTTGWDFPYSQCEFQIIGKVMFPDTSKGIMKARAAHDRDYSNYIAAQNLVQATGRGMRAEDDQCETFIIDDNIGWFVSMCKRLGFLPQWWLDSYQTVNNVPPPPPKLTERGGLWRNRS